MKNLELKLIERKNIKSNFKEGTLYKYENEYYTVKEICYDSDYTSLHVERKSNNSHIENIEVMEDLDTFKITGFRIQTTGCGSKKIKDIKEIIRGYEIAIATVEQLEKMFLNK